MIWAPSQLPKLRDQTLKYMLDPASPLNRSIGRVVPAATFEEIIRSDAVRVIVDVMTGARMFWATEEMSALAVAAGRTLDTTSWGAEARPAPRGLIVFDGGVGCIDVSGYTRMAKDIPFHAVTWGPGLDDNLCAVGFFCSRQFLVDRAPAGEDRVLVDRLPPLMPMEQIALRTDVDIAAQDLPDAVRSALQTVNAAMYLMQQPTLVERHRADVDRKIRRSYSLAGRPDPEVTTVTLRRAYVGGAPSAGTDAAGRRYIHRWPVVGHWKQQAYGPSWSLRRRQYVPAHMKGPDGAPLLIREKVNVWSR